MEHEVTERGGYRHLKALQRLTDRYGGTRAAGTPGYAASARYVKKQLTAAGYRVRYQRFSFPDFEPVTETARATGPARRTLHPLMAQFSASTPKGGLRARLAVVPGPGCAAGEYAQAAARGRIALVAGGSCSLARKQKTAHAAGARAVLLNIGAPGADANIRFFVVPREDARVPTAVLSRRESEQLTADAATGRPVELDLTLRGRHMRTSSFNLLADTPTGDPDRTVVLGAHLDGAREGPGINDNATSAAMVLETALRLAPHLDQVRHRVRFAWWGAEELIVQGSQHYVDALTPAELRGHALNLNFEMIGSPNFARMVHDGDDSDGTGAGPGPPGSDTIERELAGHFARQGLPTASRDLDGRSDYAPFMAAGVPVGGGMGGSNQLKTPRWQRLFGGAAGQWLDPCYHQVCDRIEHVDRALFGQFGKAMAHVTGRFAEDLAGIPDAAHRKGPAAAPGR
ncbi:M28 family peptidase [Streptomyces sp. SB3404]|uniref:M28 family peptidase n=1 Tax=Streptomyces boncukensis TaxID=2711219 RepID=A0A6G4X7X8_9ACTN|nr:M28 family peptidase [Streptomyces boncukensis]NGO73488.1 M28 family peptidase [Streptomyces boncukensis]